jgi:hypothetical protein
MNKEIPETIPAALDDLKRKLALCGTLLIALGLLLLVVGLLLPVF